MLKANFRRKTRGLDVRIGVMFAKTGISPNTWTALSLAPAIFGFLALYYHSLGLGLLFFAASAFMDIIDGTVARVTKSVSNLGAFLDGIADRYVEFSLYLGLWFYMEGGPQVILPSGLWLMLLVFGAMMPSFITAYADHRNVISDPERLRNIGGVLERFERLLLMFSGMLLGLLNPVYLTYTVILTVFLANMTALQRIILVIRAK